MEMIIVQFLLGVLAGTASGLFIVRRSGNTITALNNNGMVKPAMSKSRAASRQATKARSLKHRRLSRGHAHYSVRLSKIDTDTSDQGPAPQAAISSCPACGLQAPENTMAEHFLGSPSHKDNPVESTPVVTALEANQARELSEEDSRDSLRNLLQMLVPPRAFGRRHGQRGVDPLANLVQSIDSSRNATVR